MPSEPTTVKGEAMQVTIELTEEEVEKFSKYMMYSKMCGSLCPDIVPADNVTIKVMRQIAMVLALEKVNKEEEAAREALNNP